MISADCMPPKLSVRVSSSPPGHVGVPARPLHLLEALEHGLGHAVRVEAALHVGIDGRRRARGCSDGSPSARSVNSTRASWRSGKVVAVESGDAHLVERAHVRPRIDRRAHHDVVLLAVAVFELCPPECRRPRAARRDRTRPAALRAARPCANRCARLRFVRRMRTGFSTSRVPGVASMIFST